MLHTPVRSSAVDADELLSVTAVPGPGRVVVEVVGVVDAYTAPLLELCLQSRSTQPGLRELVVDLRRATFVDAAGPSVLAEARHRCRRSGARLVVRPRQAYRRESRRCGRSFRRMPTATQAPVRTASPRKTTVSTG